MDIIRPIKYAVSIPVSDQIVREGREFGERWDAWMALPAEERKRQSDEAMREAAEHRSRERAERCVTFGSAEELVRAVEEAHSWPEGYLRHLAQPYCDCGPGAYEGWEFCSHATDEFEGVGS